jgi:hypothetical protein
MFYSITIKLPKSKILQFAEPLPKNLSDLSDADFVAILNQYPDHKALANNLSKIKYMGQAINWSPSPQQQNILSEYYLGNTYRLANEQETPSGNFANPVEGANIIHSFLNPTVKNSINQAYQTLGIQTNNRFVYRVFGKNIEYTEPYNPEYISQIADPEIFKQILTEMYQNRTTPMSRSEFETLGSAYINSYGVLYKLPQKIDDQPEYNRVFKEVSQEFFPVVETQPLNPIALKEFLTNFTSATKNEYEYQRKRCKFYFYNTKEIYYFTFENVNYEIPHFDRFRKQASEEINKVWNDAVEARTSSNSIANLVFRDIALDNTIPWQEDYTFDNEHGNAEFLEFANAQYKNFENDQINTLINAIQINNKNVKIEGELGNESYSFNLSNTFFNMNSDFQKQWIQSLETNQAYEFTLQKINGSWWCKTNTVTASKPQLQNIQLFSKAFNANRYSLDAALYKNGKLFCMIEFDGSDHYGLRKMRTLEGEAEGKQNDFLNRLCADQLKSAFAREKGIQILRIPDYAESNKTPNWQLKFKQFILEKLGVIQTTSVPENINPAIKAAYKIIRLFKK